MHTTSTVPNASPARPTAAAHRIVAPSRRRLDPDRVVGLAFMIAVPVALWVSWGAAAV